MAHTDPITSDEPRAESRTARKRSVILEAATTLFLRDGYLDTSMDEIAATAAVSKQTVYKHFADKETLFRAVVTDIVSEVADPVVEHVASVRESGSNEDNLRALACRLLADVVQPRLMQLRRLVIAEANRFPELGQLFYEQGPQRTIDALAATFGDLAGRKTLRLDDPNLAAEQFNWLVMSGPLNRVMLRGDAELPSAASLRRHADTAVRTFLAAYAT
jgi:TetR/AcrR family transcriptional repressor of mexJK operon